MSHLSNLTSDARSALQCEISRYSLTRGLVIGHPETAAQARQASITQFPQVFQRKHIMQCLELTPLLHKLYSRIARDKEFLLDVFSTITTTDEFMKRLIHILQNSENKQNIHMMISRSDYMFHLDECTVSPRQIEMNTISVGLSGQSQYTSEWHDKLFLNRKLQQYIPNAMYPIGEKYTNRSLSNLAAGVHLAVDMYKEQHQVKQVGVLMVIHHSGELNIGDQEATLQALQSTGQETMYADFPYIQKHMKISNEGVQSLHGLEIGLVYYRTAYSPDTLPEHQVDLFITIESSRAIKCPSVAYHLAGCKKIQQLLADKELQVQYITEEEAEQVLAVTMPMIPANTPHKISTSELIQNYVLKPQREGGGNNIWDEQIPIMLDKLSSEEKATYILMQRVKPVEVEQGLIIQGQLEVAACVSELGVFGVLIEQDGQIKYNETTGVLVRTKKADINEGGFVRGDCALDSVYLAE